MLSYAEIDELLVYDPESGDICWRKPYGKACKNRLAGTIQPTGHRRIFVKRKSQMAHRIAWLLTHGKWPTKMIDHIDGDPSNNRLSNLREANHSENGANRRNNEGRDLPKGVCRDRNRFRANLTKCGVRQHLGCFDTAEEAHKAYMKASNCAFGNYARHD